MAIFNNLTVSNQISLIFWIGTVFMIMIWCYLTLLTILHQKMKLRYIEKINQMAESYEEEVLLLYKIINDIQADNTEITDFYLLKMVSLIYMAEEYELIDLDNYPEWETQVFDTYAKVAEKINTTNAQITLNKHRQAAVLKKIDAFKIKHLG